MYRILTIVLLIGLAGRRSNGLVVETVNDYGNPRSNLPIRMRTAMDSSARY
jgi:hypothetical protein